MPGIKWSFSKMNKSDLLFLELDGIKNVTLQFDSKKENIDAILDFTYINTSPDFPILPRPFTPPPFPPTPFPPEEKEDLSFAPEYLEEDMCFNYNTEPIEAICNRLIDFIKDRGGKCALYLNPGLNRSKEVYQSYCALIKTCKCKGRKITKAVKRLTSEKKIRVYRGIGHNNPNTYELINDKYLEIPEISETRTVNRYTHEDRLALEEELFNYIKKYEPCQVPYYVNPNHTAEATKKIHKDLIELLGNADNIKIAVKALLSKKRVEKGNRGTALIYKTIQEDTQKQKPPAPSPQKSKVKENNSKALKFFKEKAKKIKKEEEKFGLAAIYEDEEDIIESLDDLKELAIGKKGKMRERDESIEILSPERGPKREIKRKCPTCQGQLFLKNTKEDNYFDCESMFVNLPEKTYYECIQSGHTFSLEELEKIEREKIESEVLAA